MAKTMPEIMAYVVADTVFPLFPKNALNSFG
jgi:hypothetical protein